MKQKDLALIIIVAVISGMVSLGISNLLFSLSPDQQQKVAVVDPITTEFATPDPKFFNAQSIDPAKLIEVSSSNNKNPFNGSGH